MFDIFNSTNIQELTNKNEILTKQLEDLEYELESSKLPEIFTNRDKRKKDKIKAQIDRNSKKIKVLKFNEIDKVQKDKESPKYYEYLIKSEQNDINIIEAKKKSHLKSINKLRDHNLKIHKANIVIFTKKLKDLQSKIKEKSGVSKEKADKINTSITSKGGLGVKPTNGKALKTSTLKLSPDEMSKLTTLDLTKLDTLIGIQKNILKKLTKIEENMIDEQDTSIQTSLIKSEGTTKSSNTTTIKKVNKGGIASLIALAIAAYFTKNKEDLAKSVWAYFKVKKMFNLILKPIKDFVKGKIKALFKPFTDKFKQMKTFLNDKMQVLLKPFTDKIKQVEDSVKNFKEKIVTKFKDSVTKVAEAIKTSKFGKMAIKLKEGASDLLHKGKDKISSTIGAGKDLLDKGKNFFSGVWDSAKSKGSDILESGKTKISKVIKNVKESKVVSRLKEAKDYVVTKARPVVDTVKKYGGKLEDLAHDSYEGVIKFGKDKINRYGGKFLEKSKKILTPIIERFGAKTLGKAGIKAFFNQIPVVDLFAGLGFGAWDLIHGKPKLAALDILAGVLPFLADVATVASGGTLSPLEILAHAASAAILGYELTHDFGDSEKPEPKNLNSTKPKNLNSTKIKNLNSTSKSKIDKPKKTSGNETSIAKMANYYLEAKKEYDEFKARHPMTKENSEYKQLAQFGDVQVYKDDKLNKKKHELSKRLVKAKEVYNKLKQVKNLNETGESYKRFGNTMTKKEADEFDKKTEKSSYGEKFKLSEKMLNKNVEKDAIEYSEKTDASNKKPEDMNYRELKNYYKKDDEKYIQRKLDSDKKHNVRVMDRDGKEIKGENNLRAHYAERKHNLNAHDHKRNVLLIDASNKESQELEKLANKKTGYSVPTDNFKTYYSITKEQHAKLEKLEKKFQDLDGFTNAKEVSKPEQEWNTLREQIIQTQINAGEQPITADILYNKKKVSKKTSKEPQEHKSVKDMNYRDLKNYYAKTDEAYIQRKLDSDKKYNVRVMDRNGEEIKGEKNLRAYYAEQRERNVNDFDGEREHLLDAAYYKERKALEKLANEKTGYSVASNHFDTYYSISKEQYSQLENLRKKWVDASGEFNGLENTKEAKQAGKAYKDFKKQVIQTQIKNGEKPINADVLYAAPKNSKVSKTSNIIDTSKGKVKEVEVTVGTGDESKVLKKVGENHNLNITYNYDKNQPNQLTEKEIIEKAQKIKDSKDYKESESTKPVKSEVNKDPKIIQRSENLNNIIKMSPSNAKPIVINQPQPQQSQHMFGSQSNSSVKLGELFKGYSSI